MNKVQNMIFKFDLDEQQISDILMCFYVQTPYTAENGITFKAFKEAVLSNTHLTEQLKLIVRSYIMNQIYNIDQYAGCHSFGYSLGTVCHTVEDIENLPHLHYIN